MASLQASLLGVPLPIAPQGRRSGQAAAALRHGERSAWGRPDARLSAPVLHLSAPSAPALSSRAGAWTAAQDSTAASRSTAACTVPGLLLLAAVVGRRGYIAGQGSRLRGAAAPHARKLTGRRASLAQITSPTDAPLEARKFCKKGKRVEVLAPSKRWREAQVVKVSKDDVMVHYTGYDSQFDEKIKFSENRLRPFGELRSENVAALKQAFVHEPDSKMRTCPACGVPLQCVNPKGLGYIPPEKYEPLEEDPIDKPLDLLDEVKLLLKEEGVKEQTSMVFPTKSSQVTFKVVANVYLDIRTESRIDSDLQGETLVLNDTFDVCEIYRSPDARTYLRLADGRGWVFDWTDIDGTRTQLVAPLDDGHKKIREAQQSFQKVCQRCWSLWQYNDCDDVYRPGFGERAFDEMTADSFEVMLRETLEPVTVGCVFAVVDVFDFAPSAKMLRYLSKQLKNKPDVRVRIIANKIDLLPVEVNMMRIRGWIAREAQEAGHPRVKLTDVYPVSCHQGKGVKALQDLLEQADAHAQYFVVGAANAGKSSLLNRISLKKRKGAGQVPARAADGFMVSPLPGTTMRPITVKFQKGKTKLVDTPGLLVPGTLAEQLTLEEVKAVLPQKKESRRVTLHMKEGKSILLGGLARFDMVEGKPYQFTVFTSERVRLHMTRTEKADEQIRRFIGQNVYPPFSLNRFEALQPWVPHRFEFDGAGWNEACADIVIPGLGWVALTGCGKIVVEAMVPEGVEVTIRPPLMPFEAKWTGVKYKGHPGWFKVGKQTTRGNDVARMRRKIKGKF